MNDFIAPDFNPGSRLSLGYGKCHRYGRSACWIIAVQWLHNPHKKTCPATNPSREMDRAYGTKRLVWPL